MKRARPQARPPLNVDERQVLLGAAFSVLVPLGGIAAGVIVVQRLPASDQLSATVALVVGVLLGAVVAAAYALIERARRGSFFVDDPVEIARNRSLGSFRWSLVGLGLVLAAMLRLAPLRTDFLLGGAPCGVFLAWAPIVVAAYVRLRRRVGSGA